MKVLRLKDVLNMTGLSRATIYAHMSQGKFPHSIALGKGSIGWLESEVQEWISTRVKQRDEYLGSGK
ncbi:helix-turn-helix transcriptional regulator [Vibrio vulnificus]|uniref:helix-turn-helix transcriptional regulator n=1 Tax=Vibrio vulnificus TaxID=672 RepID=UPI001F042999|nr:AlpA family transcriptional regulator [Vibrio vulnificus]MCG9655172.1 AlpA family transcriptional regulator [Vibrio vulnificus]|tara:strand:+ start:136 stop:336 length:201 start_codon:yes stop_codon:yes gene_type:complete